MNNWNVGLKIGAGFALAIGFLMMIGAVSYQNAMTLTESAGWVAHTHQVLEKLTSVLSSVTDAETGQRGYIITGEERYLEPYHAAEARVEEAVSALRELTKDNDEQQHRLDLLQPLLTAKFAELEETIEARGDASKGFDAALQIVLSDKGKQAMDDLRELVSQMQGLENTLLQKRSDEAQASVRTATFANVVGTLAALLLLTLAGFLITRSIARPLGIIATTAEQIAGGDLRASIAVSARSDEVGVLAQAFARMTTSLREMAEVATSIASGDLRVNVTPQSDKDILGNAFASMVVNLRRLNADIAEGVNVLGATANQVSASTSQLAGSATETATAVGETTTTVAEVRQTTQLSSQKAKEVAETAQLVAQVSQTGKKATEDTLAGMNRIRTQMEAIAESMVRLSEQTQAISQIVATVEDLAAQSNLLAVNASIEAAKAGEQGKGFAVVAQEVKSLAEQSRQATGQVRTILNDIHRATSAAVMSTEQGGKAVEAGMNQATQAGQAIQALTASIAEAAQAASQIAASSQQQLVGVDQVAVAMANIEQASTQNVDSAKQLELAGRNLKELGARLKLQVERYKV